MFDMNAMKIKNSALVGALCVAVITMTACNSGGETTGAIEKPTAQSASPTTAPVEAAAAPVEPLASPLASPLESPLASAMQIGMAGVDRVTLRVDPGKPQQVTAKVAGYLGDACTSLGAVTQVRDGSTMRVNVGTLRPKDRMCAQVVKDFEIDVAIDVAGLAAGAYTVDVNGVAAAFEVDATGPVVR
jgi:inhibitor of cysteine peptidase